MDPEISIQQPTSLSGFCNTVIAKLCANWPPDENAIASEFVEFYALEGLLQMQDLEEFCQKIGVKLHLCDLPKPLRGHNCTYDGRSEIVVATVQGPAARLGSPEHTLLHELRELTEYEFRKLGRRVATDFSDLESRAESFASHVRVLAGFKASERVLELIAESESRIGQCAGMLLFGLLAMAYCLACANLPRWEDQL